MVVEKEVVEKEEEAMVVVVKVAEMMVGEVMVRVVKEVGKAEVVMGVKMVVKTVVMEDYTLHQLLPLLHNIGSNIQIEEFYMYLYRLLHSIAQILHNSLSHNTFPENDNLSKPHRFQYRL